MNQDETVVVADLSDFGMNGRRLLPAPKHTINNEQCLNV